MRPYYYALLEVDPGASQEEIRRAYRRLAKKVHPDVNKAPDAHEQFLQLQKAWQTLSDPVKRSSYDYLVQRYPHYSGPVPGYERRTQARPQPSYTAEKTPNQPPYKRRRATSYTPPNRATAEEEAKPYTKEWILIGMMFILLVSLPFSIRWIGYLLLPAFQEETLARVLAVDHEIDVGIDLPEEYFLTTVSKGIYFNPLTGWTWKNGMPLAVGDKFVANYLPWFPRVFRVNPNQPDEKTLTRYCFMIWEHSKEMIFRFDTASGEAMEGLFLFAFCDSTYTRFGVDGLASLLFSDVPPEVSPYNNYSTFQMLQKKPGFNEMVVNVNRFVNLVQQEVNADKNQQQDPNGVPLEKREAP
jgi:hypothetical protein